MAVDEAEFSELFASEYGRLCWLGLLLTGSRAQAEELVVPAGDERAVVLWQAVQALPARQRAVLVLRLHQDLTEAEVARLLGLPLGTVKSLGHRALARLRDRLGSPSLDPARSSAEEGR